MWNLEGFPKLKLKPLGPKAVSGVVQGVMTICDGAVGKPPRHIHTPGPHRRVEEA